MSDPRDNETIRAAWDEWNRNTPEKFWDVAVWIKEGKGEPSARFGSLDVANRFEIWAHGFAAASGPWAEQLDAARTEIVCPSCGKGCEQWNDGHITPGLWTLNCPDCGSFQLEVPEQSNLRTQLDAALARNAESYEDGYDQGHADAHADGAAPDRLCALRAELDNLRETLAQKIETHMRSEQIRVPEYETGLRRAAAIVRGSDDE